MQSLIQRSVQYIDSVLGAAPSVKDFKPEKDLSLLIRGMYKCYKAEILEETFLMVVAREKKKPSPSAVNKHFSQIEKKTGLSPVLLCSEITPYTRKELIKNKISFVVPDNQLYIPHLGISLREYYKKKELVSEGGSLSTVALLVLLYHLHNAGETEELTPSFLAGKLGYTIMSVSRALKEFEAYGLGELNKQGRKAVLKFKEEGIDLWKRSLPFLSSPVNRTVYLSGQHADAEELHTSGITLLSELTMINPASHQNYAISLSRYNVLHKKTPWKTVPEESEDKIELELWRYSPVLFPQNNQIDSLSLYLSLKDNDDERIQSALDELLEDFEW